MNKNNNRNHYVAVYHFMLTKILPKIKFSLWKLLSMRNGLNSFSFISDFEAEWSFS